jgi:hypothetical protein
MMAHPSCFEGAAVDEQALEQRLSRIEDSLSKSHRTDIETGAALVSVVKAICEAIPIAARRIEMELQDALDAVSEDEQPVVHALLQHCLKVSRQ